MKRIVIFLIPVVLFFILGCSNSTPEETGDNTSIDPSPATNSTRDKTVTTARKRTAKNNDAKASTENPEHKEAVAAIRAMGGTVREVAGRLSQTHVIFTGIAFNEDKLVDLKRLSNVTRLQFDGTQLSDAGLEHLKELNELEYLDLHSTKITDAGLERLKGLTSLKTLFT